MNNRFEPLRQSPQITRGTRFERFKHALKDQTGNQAILLTDGRVIVMRNEFSPAQSFGTLQAAIDHFNRYMPEELNDGQ